MRRRFISRPNPLRDKIVAQASNINLGAGSFDESRKEDDKETRQDGSTSDSLSNR